jgi:DNA polymerase I-like protein with 3'-5' exonuclease and polymerase domains
MNELALAGVGSGLAGGAGSRLTFPTFNAAFKVAGTISSRLASTQLLKAPKRPGYGGNLQNVPDEIRRSFIPRPGNVFVQCDLEGAEAVVVALLCAEGNFRELVRRRIKIHNFVCVKLFPSAFTDLIDYPSIQQLTPASFHEHPNYALIVKRCKKLTRQYDLAKRTVHGSNYSMGWQTFQDTVLKGTKGKTVLTAAEAKELLAVYFQLFPEVYDYQTRTDTAVREMSTLFNLFGQQCPIIGRYSPDLGRKAISWIPQSTVGCCTNIATCRLQDHIEAQRLPWHILNIVHDSILAECPREQGPTLAMEMAKAMSFKFVSPLDGWEFGIGVEKQIGMNWGKYNETENPDGLQVFTA